MDHIGLADVFRRIREDTRMTQEDFGLAYGISQATVSRCEREGRANSETVFKYMMIDRSGIFDTYLRRCKDGQNN